MFTGLIQSLGRVEALQPQDKDLRMVFSLGEISARDVALGDSIAVNGVCLTAVDIDNKQVAVDISYESLCCTLLGRYKVGDALNLELAMLPTTRFGGHIVSGHVDGLAQIDRIYEEGESTRFAFRVEKKWARFIAVKGSICIDGVSLTVNGVEDLSNYSVFDVNIIPHTMSQTIMAYYEENKQVHIEIDLMARYLDRLQSIDMTMTNS